jgi:AraC-like DNA-binding protein
MRNCADLATLVARNAPADGVFETGLERVSLVRSSAPTEPIHTFYPPSICIVAEGEKQVTIGGRVLRYDRSSFLVVGIDLPAIGAVVSASAAAPFLCLRLELDRGLLADVLAERDEAETGEAIAATGTSRATPELIDAAARLLGLAEDTAEARHLAPLVEREMLHRILSGQHGVWLRQIVRGENRLGQIDRVVRFLRTAYREPTSVDALAAMAGMSLSSFHAHFRAITAMTPLQFRNHIRLQEARRLMMTDGLTAAEAGFAVGYDSPSQFSRDYTRIHRLSPRRDVARLRGQDMQIG